MRGRGHPRPRPPPQQLACRVGPRLLPGAPRHRRHRRHRHAAPHPPSARPRRAAGRVRDRRAERPDRGCPSRTWEPRGATSSPGSAPVRRTRHRRAPVPTRRIVAIDLGIKTTIVRNLAAIGSVEVVPASTSAEEILAMEPDGVFLSNGPGDPSAVAGVPATIRDLLGEVPVFGICMGHQMLATALGASTYKLPFGHHGGNHPVRDLTTGKVEITSPEPQLLRRPGRRRRGRGHPPQPQRRHHRGLRVHRRARVRRAAPSRGRAGPPRQPLPVRAVRRPDGPAPDMSRTRSAGPSEELSRRVGRPPRRPLPPGARRRRRRSQAPPCGPTAGCEPSARPRWSAPRRRPSGRRAAVAEARSNPAAWSGTKLTSALRSDRFQRVSSTQATSSGSMNLAASLGRSTDSTQCSRTTARSPLRSMSSTVGGVVVVRSASPVQNDSSR